MPLTESGRIEYLDGLRGTLMLIGIPYHAALAFSGGPWLVSSTSASPILAALSEFLHIWRMPAFFVVAGFFAATMLRRRGPGGWLKGRLQRLGIPLAFGAVTVIPLQWLVIGRHRAGSWPAAWEFATVQAVTPSAWWVMHLWFLIELLIYCVVLAGIVATPFQRVLRRALNLVAVGVRRRPVAAGLAAAVTAGLSVVAGRAVWQVSDFDEVLNGVVSRNLVVYAPAFFIGAFIGAYPRTLQLIASKKTTIISATLGLLSAAVVIGLEPADLPFSTIASAIDSIALTVAGLAGAIVAIFAAMKVFNRPSRMITWLVDSSLVIYVVHHLMVVTCAIVLTSWGIEGVLGWGITIVFTLAVAVAVYEVVRITPGLRFLMNGSPRTGSSLLSIAAQR